MMVPMFYLVRSNDLAGRVIRWATRSKWNHAGIVTTAGGFIAAHPGGVSHEEPPAVGSHIIMAEVTPDQRLAVVNAADRRIGTPYGWWDIVSIGLLNYGVSLRCIRRRVQRSDRLICSQLVDLAFQEAGIHLFVDGRLPMDVTPGDLANLGALNVGISPLGIS